MNRISRIFRLSKPNTGKDDSTLEKAHAQEEADAAEPSTDLACVTKTLVVPPDYAKDMESDAPDQSAEGIVSDLMNEMALRNVPKPRPKPRVPAKRKRQESDRVEKAPTKVAKTSRATQHEDNPAVTSRKGTTGHKDGSNRESLEAGKVAPGKLSRPKQSPRHMIRTNPQWAPSGDEYEFPPSPGKQVEKPAPTSTTATTIPSSTNVTPRGRGRPRVGASSTKKKTSMEEGQGRKAQGIQLKPGRKRQAEPKADVNLADDRKKKTRTSRTTRSTAAAKGSKDANSNTIIKDKTSHARKGGKFVQSSDVELRPGSQDRAISAQHEGVEGEGDNSKTGRSEFTEGFMNVDDLTKANEVDEEKDEEQYEEEDEEEDEELELFGQDKGWKTVVEGARSICAPELLRNQMPRRLIGRIKDLIYEVSEARSSYEQLLPFKGLGHDGLDGLDDDLAKSFDAIEDHIKKLSEENAAEKASEMIKQLFTCAIPAMVFLLRSALASRVYHSDEPCALESLNATVNGLAEIVRLQKMTILLCEKAKSWKAKPEPSIKGPTTRKILPCLRDMQKVFSNVLSEQGRRRKLKQNALDYRLRQNTFTKSPQQAKQEALKDISWQIKIRKSREQEDQKRRDEKRTLRQVREDEARARMGSVGVNGHVEPMIIWSDAEDLALYFELEKGYAGHLTCKFM